MEGRREAGREKARGRSVGKGMAHSDGGRGNSGRSVYVVRRRERKLRSEGFCESRCGEGLAWISSYHKAQTLNLFIQRDSVTRFFALFFFNRKLF